jgi:hypothetical protein
MNRGGAARGGILKAGAAFAALLALVPHTAAAGAAAPEAEHPQASAGTQWLAGLDSVKLVAVDGSTLSLSPSEGGLSIVVTSQNGTAQRSSLSFVSDRLGTIADDADAGHVTGFFRETDNGLEEQFADGRTSSLVVNTAGGLSLTMRAADGSSSCTSWYPPDHVFSEAERKAALEAYAARLGLADKARKPGHAAPGCAPAVRIAKSRTAPGATQPLMVITRPGAAAPAATEISAKGSSGPAPVEVRDSKIHLIDLPVPAAKPQILAATPASFAPPPAMQPLAGPAKAPAGGAGPAIQASVAAKAPPAAGPAVSRGQGASDCLSVDSDGASLGFRNHCAYAVQFAYCVRRSADASTSCDAGSKTGAVAANGFAAVLPDTNIKTADAEHDFRWVACSGDTGVVAHLDSADPPAGRCVLNGAT